MSAEESRTRLRQTGRNDPCPCGSGKKYKKCHRPEDEAAVSSDLAQQRAQAEQAAAQEQAEEKPSRGHDAKPGQRQARSRTGQGGARSQDQGQRSANLPRRGAI